MTDYAEYQTERAPIWLQDNGARAVNTALGLLKDAFVYGCKAAVKQRFPQTCSADALPAIAADRTILVGYRESESQTRARIAQAWSTAEKLGTKPGMVEELTRAGYANVSVREQPDDGSLAWFEFDVWLRPTFPWPASHVYAADGRWGDPGTWDDGGVWAEEIPRGDVELLKAIVRKGTPRHARCRQIVVVHAGEAWDDTAPPGTWDDDPAATWGNDVTILQVFDAQ